MDDKIAEMRDEAINGPQKRSSLDEKLINAVCSYASGVNQRVRTERELLDNALSNIKQAFASAGYVHIPQVESERIDGVEILRINGKKVMTGQEWEQRALKAGWRRPNEIN